MTSVTNSTAKSVGNNHQQIAMNVHTIGRGKIQHMKKQWYVTIVGRNKDKTEGKQ